MPNDTGIKIIKNNFKKNSEEKSKKIHIICEYCDSELEISEEDTHIGWLGAAFVKCPCCGQESMVDELDGITLTKNNIKFPIHFNRTNKNLRNVVEIQEDEIVNEIKKGINYFRINKNKSYWYTSFGDLFIILFKYDEDEEYFVFISKDFYETYIPFERQDYDE